MDAERQFVQELGAAFGRSAWSFRSACRKLGSDTYARFFYDQLHAVDVNIDTDDESKSLCVNGGCAWSGR